MLEISEETIQKRVEQSHKRVEQSHKRPNVNKLDPIALYRERKPLYNLMNYDIKIDSSHKHTALALQNKKLSCVAGFPIEHSLSPHLHNSCYKDLKIDDTHVFTKIEICPKNFHKIKNIIRTLNLK